MLKGDPMIGTTVCVNNKPCEVKTFLDTANSLAINVDDDPSKPIKEPFINKVKDWIKNYK